VGNFKKKTFEVQDDSGHSALNLVEHMFERGHYCCKRVQNAHQILRQNGNYLEKSKLRVHGVDCQSLIVSIFLLFNLTELRNTPPFAYHFLQFCDPQIILKVSVHPQLTP
jgi:hypothetical protein